MKKRKLVLTALLVSGLLIGGGSLVSCFSDVDQQEEEIAYTISYNESHEYIVTFMSESTEYANGDRVEFIVEATTGYSITSVAYNGTTLTTTSENTYSFIMPAENVTLTINTTENVYTVSYETSSEYTVNFTSGSNEFNYRDSVEFTVIASTGYTISSVAYNGTTITATSGNTYSFEMPAEDVTLNIEIEAFYFSVTTENTPSLPTNVIIHVSTNDGTNNPLTDGAIVGQTIHIYFEYPGPEQGYLFDLSINNGQVGYTEVQESYYYTFEMPAEDVVISVNRYGSY